MIITEIKNGIEIQKAFIKKFTLTYDQFKAKYKDRPMVINHLKTESDYDRYHLWDKLNCSFAQPVFGKALEFLRKMPGDVLIMPDPSKSNGSYLTINGTERKNCVAYADASELADLIEYEWLERWKAWSQDIPDFNSVLPEDLYVFDANMEHVLIFTHEYDFWKLESTEEFLNCVETRWCFSYGFPN
jgi:hypothetical protein